MEWIENSSERLYVRAMILTRRTGRDLETGSVPWRETDVEWLHTHTQMNIHTLHTSKN